jgi:hypothetical protein
MKTKKGSNPINIFNQSLVADYVAGHLNNNEKVRDNFEKALANDEALQKAVDEERLLRDALVNYELSNRGPVVISVDGVESLMAKLDSLDERSAADEPSGIVVHALFANRKNWFAATGVAASIGLATVLLVGFQPSTVEPGFELLSDGTSTEQASFNDLVKAQRVVQIWLVSELPQNELSKLFDEYQLTPISRAGQAWIVSSRHKLSSKQLENLEAQEMFKQVHLISYDN